MNMRLVALAITTLVVVAQCQPPEAPPTVKKGNVCVEDDECWDCHSMGNNICGTNLGE